MVLQDGLVMLHRMIMDKQPELAMVLIEAGAPLELRSKNRSTVLHLAAWSGLADVAKTILDRKGNDDDDDDDEDEAEGGGAAGGGKEGGSGSCERRRRRCRRHRIDGSALLEARTEDKDSALHQAAFQDHRDVAALLLAKAADAAKRRPPCTSACSGACRGWRGCCWPTGGPDASQRPRDALR